ncbi:MAG TPA: DUF1217 domain-containing protein [Alphaproteobacteria bacterium]|nr:DUF1217 domain-containing protein [Alphaproteobacteria bacterium]
MVDGISLPAFPTFQRLVRSDSQKLIAKFQERPAVEKEIQYFRDKAPKLKSMDDLFKDQRLLRFIASAYSLDDEVQYPARLRKVLESKITDPASLANRMVDPRYKEMAGELMLGDLGVIVFSTSSTIDKVVNRYIQNEYEKDLGKTNPALREASYFLRKIGSIKDSLSILGDGVLRSVVTFTLDLPPQIAFQSIDKQRSLIDARLDVKKFINGAATTGGTRTVDQAKTDLPEIDKGLQLTSAAATQVQTVISRLQGLKDDYARVANVQNPSGPFASEIPVQQAAAPELTRMSGLLAAAQDGLGQMAPLLQRMAEIITAARDSANAGKLSDYKAEFADLKSKVDAAVAGATYIYDDDDTGSAGTAQNLLDGTLPATITVQTTSAGDTVSIRGQNLSGLLAAVTSANNAFQAVSGSGDTANLDAAQAATTEAGDDFNAASITLSSDRALLQQGVNSVTQWAATFNTSQVYPGYQAARDAGSRIAQIKLALSEIRTLAQDSANRADGADRSDLTGRFGELVDQVTDLVNTAGNGFDNLLAGGDRDYNLLNDVFLHVRGRDLNGSVVSPLTSGDITTAAGAQAVLDALTATVDPAVAQAGREIGVDTAPLALTANSLDPRAAVDSRYRALTEEIAGIVAGATVNKQNLLDPTQSEVKIKVQTSGQTVTISPQTGFDAGITQIIEAGADLLPSSSTDASGALAKIDEALFNANRALSFINADIRALNVERGVAQAVISASSTQIGNAPKPFEATDFAIQFIKKYLIKKDMEANSQNFGLGSLVTSLAGNNTTSILTSISGLSGRGRLSLLA